MKRVNKFKIYWEVYGCEMNKSQADSLKKYLSNHNFEETTEINDADFVFIYTCSVRASAEDRIFGRLGYFKYVKMNLNPFLTVVVLGCLVEEYFESLIKDDLADIIVGTKYQELLPEYLYKNKISGFRGIVGKKALDSKEVVFLPSSIDSEFSFRAYITISHGCSNFCNYCIVPYLRGKEVSRDSGDIINDVKNLVSFGVKEFILLGQNVNSYGIDNNDIPFYELLNKLSKIDGVELISYLSPHPKDFSDELIKITAVNPKISKLVHIPLQSGSNKILKLMNRKYTIEKYLNIIEKFRKFNPDIKFSTDIIVGFTDETDEDFEKTLEIVKKVKFIDAFMYKYSKRPLVKTKLPDNVSEEIKLQRLQVLIEIQNKISIDLRKKEIGTDKKVIILKNSKKDKNKMLFKSFDGLFGVVDKEYSNIGTLKEGNIVDVEITSLNGKTLIAKPKVKQI